MTTPDLHPAIAHLAPLIGTWRGGGRGEYPTIDDFEYTEEVVFSHVGKPFVAYVQRTRDLAGMPLHTETGYIRPAGEDRVECLIVQPTGIVEEHAGTFDGTELDLTTTNVLLTPTAKSVTAVERTMSFEDDVCRYRMSMAAVGEPMTFHLEAELHRAEG